MLEYDAKDKSLSDEQLMRLVQNGNLDALEQLYRKYGKLVRSGIARFSPQASDADIDELCQEVFIVVQKRASQYTEQQKFKSWLYSITAKKSRQWHRNLWLRHNLTKQFATENTAVALPISKNHDERLEIRRAIDAAIMQLSRALREPFILYASEGFTAAETAEILGLNERTVFTRIFRARKQLAQLLAQQFGYVPTEVKDEPMS